MLFILWLIVVECPLLVLWSSFYSTILGFLACHDSLLLLFYILKPMLCQQHWWLVLSLFFHFILLLRFVSQKFLANFPLLGYLDEASSNTFPKSRLTILLPKLLKRLFKAFLAVSPFVSFLQIGRFLLDMLKDSHLPSFLVPLLTFPEVLGSLHQVLIPKPPPVPKAFLLSYGWLMGHDFLRSLCPRACLLKLSTSQLVLSCTSRRSPHGSGSSKVSWSSPFLLLRLP